MNEITCPEHFYMKESLKDFRKDLYRTKKDIFQMKFMLLIILINTFGFSEIVFKLIGGLI